MKRPPGSIDRNRALALAGAANGGNLSIVVAQCRDQFPSRGKKSIPPILRILFGAYGVHDVKRNGRERPLMNDLVEAHEGALAAGGSQVYGQYKLVVTCSHYGLS